MVRKVGQGDRHCLGAVVESLHLIGALTKVTNGKASYFDLQFEGTLHPGADVMVSRAGHSCSH